MTAKPTSCRRIEADLVATATGEAAPDAAQRVNEHVRACPPCRDEMGRYAAIEGAVGHLREAAPLASAESGRASLAARLADLRSRRVAYRIFASPLGRLLIARSELGVSLVEYLDPGAEVGASRLRRADGFSLSEGNGEIETLYRDLIDYLEGRRTRLAWPLDLRLARSDFHRRVLDATAAIPYGAVVSYAGLAREIGRPDATRAVAQALRTNPLPIVVPCHRIVGTSGALTGYAGDKISLKERLLGVEGVPTAHARRDVRVARDMMYIRAGHDAEYCIPSCGDLATTTLASLTLFATREGAESIGLAPCGSCRPDLHPLRS
jgi:methylated-DNA-[protein]-cysteine S-methyltransferase